MHGISLVGPLHCSFVVVFSQPVAENKSSRLKNFILKITEVLLSVGFSNVFFVALEFFLAYAVKLKSDVTIAGQIIVDIPNHHTIDP